MANLHPVRGLLEKTTPEFRTRLVEVAEWLGVDPTDLAAIIAFESGFDPRATNQLSQATGLIQWMPATARSLYSLTVAQIKSLSAVEQLDLVGRYFAGVRGRALTVHDLYMLVWNGSPAAQDKVLGVADGAGHQGAVYRQNSGLDRNHDGIITAGEASSIVRGIAAEARKLPPVVDVDPKATASTTDSNSPSGPLCLRSYTVKRGDYPWALAERFAGDGNRWKELFGCNARASIERLLANSEIQLPIGWDRERTV